MVLLAPEHKDTRARQGRLRSCTEPDSRGPGLPEPLARFNELRAGSGFRYQSRERRGGDSGNRNVVDIPARCAGRIVRSGMEPDLRILIRVGGAQVERHRREIRPANYPADEGRRRRTDRCVRARIGRAVIWRPGSADLGPAGAVIRTDFNNAAVPVTTLKGEPMYEPYHERTGSDLEARGRKDLFIRQTRLHAVDLAVVIRSEENMIRCGERPQLPRNDIRHRYGIAGNGPAWIRGFERLCRR